MNKVLKWRLVVLAIFTTLLGGTFIFKPDVDKTGGLVANVKLADIEKPKITIPKKPEKKKTSQPKRDIKKAPKPKTKPKAKPVWKPPANIIFSETFSSFPVGHLMSNWGDDLVVKSTQSGGRGRKFLTSQTPGEYHSMTIPINFSKHWNMSILSRQECGALLGIVFYDDSGNSLPIKCSWRNCYGPMYLSFPGATTKITTPFRIEKGMYPIDISYIKGVLKFVMSNEHIYSGRLTYNHAFTRVQFTWQDYKQSSRWWKRAPDFYKIEVRKVEGPAGAKTTERETYSKVPSIAANQSFVHPDFADPIIKLEKRFKGLKIVDGKIICPCHPTRKHYSINQFGWGLFLGEHGLSLEKKDWFIKRFMRGNKSISDTEQWKQIMVHNGYPVYQLLSASGVYRYKGRIMKKGNPRDEFLLGTMGVKLYP